VSSEIRIRTCGVDDAAALALVGRATFLETYADVLPVEDMLAYTEDDHSPATYAAWLADPAYRIWAAERTDTRNLVGYVMLCPPDLPDLPTPTGPDDLEVKRIYVLAPLKGGGVGAKLMAVAVEAARAAGAKRVLLGVHGENTAAQAFYARQGYTQAGVRKFRVGANTYDDLVLAMAL
jgi:ribosomal protein S18 acetylase RimI-like enzyme